MEEVLSWYEAAAIGALILTAALAAPALRAEPIDSDGPDFVDSSEVVPKGRFQYELDVTHQRPSRARTPIDTEGASALLKYGLGNTVELRVTAERSRSDAPPTTPRGGSSVGLKWHSTDRDPDRNIPAVSWILELGSAPGAPVFQHGPDRMSLRSIATWDLPAGFAFGVMPGLGSGIDAADRRFTSAMFGAVLNRRMSERDRLFVEVSLPQIAASTHGGTNATLDVGGAHLLNEDVQLGFRAGVGANRRSPKNYLLLELAQRF